MGFAFPCTVRRACWLHALSAAAQTAGHVPRSHCKRWAKLLKLAWPGYMYELWSVVPVVLCSFLPSRSSSTSTSLLPSIDLTCLLYCIGDLRLPYCPLTSSYGSDWTHAPQLPSQTTFFFTSQRQHKLPSHHHITTGRFLFFLTLTSQPRPHPACTIKHSAFPPTNHKPLPKHPAK